MGTMIPFSLLKSQYKAVIIALGGITVAGVLILTIIPLIFDYPTAVAGVGPISGGIIALIITSEKLTEIGLTSLVIIPALDCRVPRSIGNATCDDFHEKICRKTTERHG